MHTVLRAHYLIADYFIESRDDPLNLVGVKSENLLHSALSRQEVGYGGQQKWPDPIQKAATLFFGLIKNYAFHDGNKRTAFLVAIHHLMSLDRTLTVPAEEFELLAVRTAASELHEYPDYRRHSSRHPDPEVYYLFHLFKRYTRPQKVERRTVTFRQLTKILRRFGFDIRNPRGNSADVIRSEDGQRVWHIGYPGGSRQVGAPDLERIREACGLTPDEGYDTPVFFDGADPLEVLIDEYRDPLERLADS